MTAADQIEKAERDMIAEAEIAFRPVAEEALAKADATELLALYREAIKDREALKMCVDTISKHYITKDGHGAPRFGQDSESAVAAMQTVALAAIDLAKSILSTNGAKK